jgi:3-hydroxyisobutyrate dehydrogenase
MRIALVGVGRMGGALAERLRLAGHELTLFDVRPGDGFAPSAAAAGSGADLAFFCLPDEAAVRRAAEDLAQADPVPPLLVDLTSSLPDTTRLVAARLAHSGVAMIDVPLSGGVPGAREGRLTGMAGGDQELIDRARPALTAFCSAVLRAGPLGAGHAIKAINNSLSAASFAVTAEMLVRAERAGQDPAAVVEHWNQGPARSQNSEVKFPRDILTATYGSGFTLGLMVKDIATALRIASGHGLDMPVTAGVHRLWVAALDELGSDADYTRMHEHLALQPGAGSGTVEEMGRAIAAVCLLAGCELIPLAEREGVARDRALEIVNVSSGRSEATRADLAWPVDMDALSACAPMLTLPGA